MKGVQESKVKYLVNWTQVFDCCGGSERRYTNLKRAFPDAELISVKNLTESDSIREKRNAVDSFLKNNTDENDIVIRDVGVGGISRIKAKTILIFGNPYLSLLKRFPKEPTADHWKELLNAQMQDAKISSLNIANSVFSKHDAELSGCKINKVIPNGVDIDFWKPSKALKRIYPLWVGSNFKERVVNIKLHTISTLVTVYKKYKLTKQEMLFIYQKAFCLFHPFPIEGNSNAVLEAMACDVPIISLPSGWFWNNSFDLVGYKHQSIEESLKLMGNKFDKFHPRQYVINNKLTLNDYIKNMKDAIKCLR